jgi:EAL domain-containing protein (putative c-di-GMP-specific phosphodiesterase class I)
VIDGQPLACFQPFIDTATGRIAGVEALGRLRQADGQLTSVGPLFADSRTLRHRLAPSRPANPR